MVELRSNVTVLSLTRLVSDGSTVRGLVINSSAGGIAIDSDNNRIVGNRFGTNPAGTAALPITGGAIGITGNNNTIGGPNPGDRNIISSSAAGISITGGGVFTPTGNVIEGNFIGTDNAGNAPLGNTVVGVDLRDGARNNTVGPNNVISGNGTGITIVGNNTTGNTVAGNFIGTDGTGLACDQDGMPNTGDEMGNVGHGVQILDADLNVIGGLNPADRNVISCNGLSGVSIEGSADDNFVQGNFIGTDDGGTAALGNAENGVIITNSTDNAIGGAAAGARNIISGNGFNGVSITGVDATDNLVLGNRIGIDAGGTARLGNGLNGVSIQDAPGNTIGGPNPGAGNLISGNSDNGVLITGVDAQNNAVEGNFIGTDVDGQQCDQGGEQFGNDGHGVEIFEARMNVVGGLNAGDGNVISCNGMSGVSIEASAEQNSVRANFIGTNEDGTEPLGNGDHGVSIVESPDNIIGGAGQVGRNIISANTNDGVSIAGMAAARNQVYGNHIGTDVDGTEPLANGDDGVQIDGAPNNLIGGAIVGEGNLISANDGNGVFITGPNATGTSVRGNQIGTDVNGTAPLGNGVNGVGIQGAPMNTIGGPGAGEGNLISANGQDGVFIVGAGAAGNTVQGNTIGTDVDGTDPLGNGIDGIGIQDAPNNNIGGAAPDEGNLISANAEDGVFITGIEATGNSVQGNRIGTDASGTALLGNGFDGVGIEDAPGNLIGGGAGARNIISGNADAGVFINGPEATLNRVQGNFIGLDADGNALGNGSGGVFVQDAPENTIGGLQALNQGNIISGNGESGVIISGTQASENLVAGNLIGTDQAGSSCDEPGGATGNDAMGNDGDGVRIDDAPENTIDNNVISCNALNGVLITGTDAQMNSIRSNLIGTDESGTDRLANGSNGVEIDDALDNLLIDNLVSGNGLDGVLITGNNATSNELQGNFIGTDNTGINPLGNDGNGVQVNDAPGNTIGVAGNPNLISDNEEVGILITGSDASGNVVQGNHIGSGVVGTERLGNRDDGVKIENAPNNQIGGSAAGEGNLISDNTFRGVLIQGDQATGNQVKGNVIGVDKFGTLFRGNGLTGVEIDNASDNEIGGPTEGDRNVVSGNGSNGILVFGVNAAGNTVQGNFIGTDLVGTGAFGNGLNGVEVVRIPGATIGGTVSESNLIAFNVLAGISVDSGTGTSIGVNSIHDNGELGIDLNAEEGAPDGVTANDPGDADDGANGLQNYPIITDVAGLPTRIAGTLNSLPSSEFLIRFYSNTTSDPTGFGEGERFLGEITVTTDAQGDVAFDETLTNSEGIDGCVTATAEHVATSNTSEFSACFSPLVINEIDYDQVGVDGSEFIELKNNNESVPIDLDGMEIQLIDGDGGGATVYQNIGLPAVGVAPGDYYVICSDGSSVPECDLVVTLGSDFIQNGTPDAVALVLGTSILDTVSYGGDTGSPYTEGSGSGLLDDPNLDLSGLSRIPDGQDTDRNNVDFIVSPATPGAENLPAAVAVLDVTGNGSANPFEDGIIMVRYMLDQPDANLADPMLIQDDATRTTGAEIRAFLDAAGDALDVNGDGKTNPFQDGILIVRFLLRQPDPNLEDASLIPMGSTRTTAAEIRAYLETLLPPSAGAAIQPAGSGEGEKVVPGGLDEVTAADALRAIDRRDRDRFSDVKTQTHNVQTLAVASLTNHRSSADTSLAPIPSADAEPTHRPGEAVDHLLSDHEFVESL